MRTRWDLSFFPTRLTALLCYVELHAIAVRDYTKGAAKDGRFMRPPYPSGKVQYLTRWARLPRQGGGCAHGEIKVLGSTGVGSRREVCHSTLPQDC